ncbi:MAG: tetratricopeptide repeat protein, partial [Planctomycetota bacterium]
MNRLLISDCGLPIVNTGKRNLYVNAEGVERVSPGLSEAKPNETPGKRCLQTGRTLKGFNKRCFPIILTILVALATGCAQPKSLRRALLGITERHMAQAAYIGGNERDIQKSKLRAWETARLAAALYPDDADAVLMALNAGKNIDKHPYNSMDEICLLELLPVALDKIAREITFPEITLTGKYPGETNSDLPLSANIENLAEKHPELPQARIWLGDNAFANNRFDDALAHYLKAYEADPEHPGARGAYAIALMKVGEWEKASALFMDHARDAARHYTPLSFFDEATTYAYLRFGSPPELLRRLEPEMQDANMGAERYLALAIAALRASRYQSAYSIYREAIKQGHGKNFPAIMRMLLHYQFLRNLKEYKLYPAGVMAARRALEEFPENSAFNYFLGYFQEHSGQEDAAWQAYERAEKLSPFRSATAAARRRLSTRKGSYRSGIDIWLPVAPEKMIRSEKNRLRDRFKKLLETAKKAEEEPSADSITDFGNACLSAGWTEEAGIAFENALRLDRTHEGALRGLHKAKQHQKLVESLTNYMESNYRRERRDGVILSIDEVLKDMEDIAKSCVVLPPQKENPLYSVALFGSEVCPISRPGGALVAYFLSHSQYLELQQTASGGVECKLMTLTAVLDRKVKVNGGEIPYSFWVCERSLIRGSAGQLGDGGHIAGSASYSTDGFFVEFESLEPDFFDFRLLIGQEPIPLSPLEKYRRKRY